MNTSNPKEPANALAKLRSAAITHEHGSAGALSRREVLRTLALATAGASLVPGLSLAKPDPGEANPYGWVNQKNGPRPRFVWENREDVIYHDLSYDDKAVETAPEIAPFMGRRWVFNRSMTWHRKADSHLRLRLYDLNRQKLVQELPFSDSINVELGTTDADYFLLVTPQ